jgi:glycosyltransferase involved in cell wall biosynthesis
LDRTVFFVLPAGSEAVSGGNIFNREIVASLRDLVSLRAIGVEPCRQLVIAGTPGIYLLDTLDLESFLRFPAPVPGQFFVLIVHHLPSLEPGLDPGHPSIAVEKAALPRFDAFVTTSPLTTELLAGRGFPAEKLLQVAPALYPLKRKARAYEPPVRALLVGNLIPRKAILELLAALEALVQDGDRFFLEIVGRADLDRGYAGSCERLIADSRPLRSHVALSGAVPYEGMSQRYEAANLFVSSAKMETFGMALHEAVAHGLPILCRDGGYASRHFVAGDDGLLFHSSEALAGGLLALARDNQRMAAFFARAQARTAQAYSWNDAARTLLTQLEKRFVADARG